MKVNEELVLELYAVSDFVLERTLWPSSYLAAFIHCWKAVEEGQGISHVLPKPKIAGSEPSAAELTIISVLTNLPSFLDLSNDPSLSSFLTKF
jgi:hypothetical protein